MKIKKLSIASFGKIKDKTFFLGDGLNVVYGNNESGKSTIVSFIRYMLFGFHGRRGGNALTQEEKYSPWDNTAVSGSMDFESGADKFMVSRSNGVRREYSVVNTDTGNASFEGVDVGEEIYNLNESAFMRTYCLSAVSAGISADRNDDIIKRLSNLTASGDETFSHEAVSAKIGADIKSLRAQIAQKNDEIEEMRNSLDDIEHLRERQKNLNGELYSIDSGIEKMRENLDDTSAKNGRYEMLSEKLHSAKLTQKLRLLLFAVIAVCSTVLLVTDSLPLPAILGGYAVAVFDLLLIAFGALRLAAIRKALKKTKIDAPIYDGDVRNDIKRNETQKSDLLKELGAIESKLGGEYSYDDICSQIGLFKSEKAALETKLETAVRAQNILAKSYEEMKSIFAPALNERASEIFSSLTGYKYNDMLVTDSFGIRVKEACDYKNSMFFSGGTVELMYVSVRLALCDILDGESKNPVILDDCFSSLDDARARTALEFLADYAKGRQIIFCTCHGRELSVLSSLDKVNIINI